MKRVPHKYSEITTQTGEIVQVVRLLGSGGQGEVWLAQTKIGQRALKLYYPSWIQIDSNLFARLTRLVSENRPPASNFVWPEALVTAKLSNGIRTFGYLMPVVDTKRFRSLRELSTRRLKPSPTFRTLLTIAYGIAEAFWLLHARGFCYRDVSKDNILFDPNTGEIRVVDNDNVDANNTEAAVWGTPEFMAPELVRQDVGCRVNRYTDLHALAVMLFYVMHLHHPLEGKRALAIHVWDDAAMRFMHGTNPLFIFDPKDRANCATPADKKTDPTGVAGDIAIRFWHVYPEYIHTLFFTTFGPGLLHPPYRVSVADWRAYLSRTRDSIVICPYCSEENFTEVTGRVVGNQCWNKQCMRVIPTPYKLLVGHRNVMLNADTKLYPHHVNPQEAFVFTVPVAEVRQHPTQKMFWGLANLSKSQWTARKVSGEYIDVPPGKSVLLEDGITISFGSAEGKVSM